MKIAIIPARGGSKRIPRKNIRDFFGKPMIAWTLEAALSSKCFSKVLVSTEDDEIADIALSLGAWVPFKRPLELCDDYATTAQVIQHAFTWLKANEFEPSRLCTLYATAPFLTKNDIIECEKLLDLPNTEIAFAATSYAFPIQRAIKLTQDGHVEMFQPEFALTRSQDLEKAYHDAGMIYWSTAKAMNENLPTFSKWSRAYLMSRDVVQDIDDDEDWFVAEQKFRQLKINFNS